MNWNKWFRQTHRWLSIVFTLLVLVNIIINIFASGQEQLVLWVGLLTLIPLFLLYSAVCTCSCCRTPLSGVAGDAPTKWIVCRPKKAPIAHMQMAR